MIPTVSFANPLEHVLVLQVTQFVEVATFIGHCFLGVELFGCNIHISRSLFLHVLLERFLQFLLH